jgi:hypothetical protein
MQRMLAKFIDNRMPRVITTLKADHHIYILGQIVDDAAFTFVAPLSAYDCGHSHGGLSCLALVLSRKRLREEFWINEMIGTAGLSRKVT